MANIGVRSVIWMLIVCGHTLATVTLATAGSPDTRVATAFRSTRASGVPAGTSASRRTSSVATILLPCTATVRTPNASEPSSSQARAASTASTASAIPATTQRRRRPFRRRRVIRSVASLTPVALIGHPR